MGRTGLRWSVARNSLPSPPLLLLPFLSHAAFLISPMNGAIHTFAASAIGVLRGICSGGGIAGWSSWGLALPEYWLLWAGCG